MNTRKTVFLCNMAIIALCVLSILSYFIMPFWKIKVEYTLTADSLGTMLSSEGSANEDETVKSLADELDFTEIVGEDGLSLNLSLTFKTADILSALSAEPTVVVERILNDNVHNFVYQMSDTLSKVVKTAVNLVVKSALKEGVKEELYNIFDENLSDAEAQAKLDAAGITDEYLNEKSNQLVNSLYKEGATAESAANSTVDIVEETIQKMKNSGDPDYADLKFTEENRAELTADLTEQFKNFENEDGSLNLENFTTDFIMEMLKSTNSSNETAAALATPLSAKASTAEEDENTAELRQLLLDEIMKSLEGAEEGIASVAKTVSYVILVTFAIWALPIVKILLKMNKPNNAIKLGLPIWFGSIPYVVLCLAPNLALSMLLPSWGAAKELSGLSIVFSSCSMFSFIVGIVFAVFVLFFYGKQRRILKRGGGYVQTTTES